MNNLVPIVYDGERILTTEQLAQVYGTEPRRITENFNNNKIRFGESKHYFCLKGQRLKEFLQYASNVVQNPSKIRKLYLWTERGADRHCKILDTDKAWEQFDHLEDTYFKIKENNINTDQLSPETQLILRLSKSIARNEIENKKIKSQISSVKEDVQTIRDVITLNPQSAWRRECNKILNAIGKEIDDYSSPKKEAYKSLKIRGNCRPSVLVINLKKRAKLNGMSNSKIENLNILDVLENEPRLKEIYVSIVKEMAIKHGIKILN